MSKDDSEEKVSKVPIEAEDPKQYLLGGVVTFGVILIIGAVYIAVLQYRDPLPVASVEAVAGVTTPAVVVREVPPAPVVDDIPEAPAPVVVPPPPEPVPEPVVKEIPKYPCKVLEGPTASESVMKWALVKGCDHESLEYIYEVRVCSDRAQSCILIDEELFN